MKRLLLAFLLVARAGAQPPPVHVMYLDSAKEAKASVLIKREYYPWPLMRIGYRSSGEHGFGLVRFWVAPGARRSDMLRQCRQAALLMFRTFPGLHTLDLDAAPADDNDQVKAAPWFAATLEKSKAQGLSLELTPEAWFRAQGPITLHDELAHDADPARTLVDELLVAWRRPLPRKPKPLRRRSPEPLR